MGVIALRADDSEKVSALVFTMSGQGHCKWDVSEFLPLIDVGWVLVPDGLHFAEARVRYYAQLLPNRQVRGVELTQLVVEEVNRLVRGPEATRYLEYRVTHADNVPVAYVEHLVLKEHVVWAREVVEVEYLDPVGAENGSNLGNGLLQRHRILALGHL